MVAISWTCNYFYPETSIFTKNKLDTFWLGNPTLCPILYWNQKQFLQGFFYFIRWTWKNWIRHLCGLPIAIKNTCTIFCLSTLNLVWEHLLCTTLYQVFTHLNAAFTNQNFINILLHISRSKCDTIAKKFTKNRVTRRRFPWQVNRIWWCIVCYCHDRLSYWNCCRIFHFSLTEK